MVVVLTSGASNGDHISNTVCADADGPGTVLEACDTERTLVGGATVTPTPIPTAVTLPTAIPTIPPLVIVPVPTARALPTLSPPITGTGSTGSGGSGPLAVGLGLAGAALLLVSGFALVKRTR